MDNETHHYRQLIAIFDRCFAESLHTRLIKGDEEPVYLPADPHTPYHRIVFAHGFYASALHEIAHWCIAGPRRHLLVDFGYWYCPDGRDSSTQQRFEAAEIKPQALEWLFCAASGFPFNVSCDNLDGEVEPDHLAFQQRVHRQVMAYLAEGIPQRAARFIAALREYYRTRPLSPEQFRLATALDAAAEQNNHQTEGR
ncbi:elongation factor P hydroxylase [Martelella alba]|uniref:Elongation factor P hydroxylase n=1 Tax=Martelella alba TaxID=2590451 RepID=A0ABY2SH19_9HYPH|nr:elongation factor P hydroxylase [Martelella alba]TKI03853.1 elongation factor P hydroxylase [Martelella alba]